MVPFANGDMYFGDKDNTRVILQLGLGGDNANIAVEDS